MPALVLKRISKLKGCPKDFGLFLKLKGYIVNDKDGVSVLKAMASSRGNSHISIG